MPTTPYIILSDSEGETPIHDTITISETTPLAHTPLYGHSFEDIPVPADPMDVDPEEEFEESSFYDSDPEEETEIASTHVIPVAPVVIPPTHPIDDLVNPGQITPSYTPMTHTEWDQVIADFPQSHPLAGYIAATFPTPAVTQAPPTLVTPPSEDSTHQYTPLEPYASPVPYVFITGNPSTSVHPQHAPSAQTQIPVTAEDLAWIANHGGHPPFSFGASTSAPPPIHEDQTGFHLIDQISDHEVRLDHLETTVEILAGPDHVEELQQMVYHMDDRVQQIASITQDFTTLVPPPEMVLFMEHRITQMEQAVGSLRHQIQGIHGMISDIHRRIR